MPGQPFPTSCEQRDLTAQEKAVEFLLFDLSSCVQNDKAKPTPPPPVRGAYVSVFDLEGQLLSRWGGSEDPCAPGDFFAPHGICVDSRGAVYVGEVVMSAGGYKGKISPTCHSLQKFVPVG
jgi:hypothetical protein